MPEQRHSQPTPTSLGQTVCACLGVTCHLHFWQNDRGLLRATAVIGVVERTPNKSQHTKLTLEKKILLLLLPGFELTTFRSRVWGSYQQAIPAPRSYIMGVSTPILQRGKLTCHASWMGTPILSLREEAVCTIHHGCGITHVFSRGRIIF